MVYFHIVMFLLFQVVANIFFKWGGSAPQNYWRGFVLGNAVGITSIIFLLGMYRSMPAAGVIAIGTGGTFLLNQLTMRLLYREPLTPAATVGLVLIFVGILMTALFNTPSSDAPAGGRVIAGQNGGHHDEK